MLTQCLEIKARGYCMHVFLVEPIRERLFACIKMFLVALPGERKLGEGGREGGRLGAGKSVGKMWYGGPPEVRRLDSLSRQLKMY